MNIIRRAIVYAIDHPVLANVSMLAIFVFGYLAAIMLPVQFLPDFNPEVLVVVAKRDHASASEMRDEVMRVIDPQLYGLPNIDSIQSRARPGVCFWVIRLTVGQHSKGMADQVYEKLAKANLTQVDYQVSRPVMKHPVLSFVMWGPKRLTELAAYANQARLALLSEGIDHVKIQGLERENIELSIASQSLFSSGLSINQIADQIAQNLQDNQIDAEATHPVSGQSMLTHPHHLHALDAAIMQKDSAIESRSMLNTSEAFGFLSPRVFYHDQPAVSITINRTVGGTDVFTLQKQFRQWLSKAKAQWGDQIQIKTYEETWKMLAYRIQLLLENGVYGLVLIILLLGCFFHVSLAKWIASGIPICIAVSCVMLYMVGGTINFLSTFAFVMALGIIVDDTIVIAEQAYSEYQNGVAPRQAVLNACEIMFTPIMAASFTTIASFIPLLIIPGEYGKIMIDIPRVIICVLVASIIECFLILPRHIRTALEKFPRKLPQWQERLQSSVQEFQHHKLKKVLVQISRHAILASITGLALISFPLILAATGRIAFSFFPSPPNDIILMDASFNAGTTESQVYDFLRRSDQELSKINRELSPQNEPIVEVPLQFAYQKAPKSLVQFNKGITADHASMILGLSLPDSREVSNEELIKSWYQQIPKYPYVKNISITEPRAGPPVPDIRILIKGQQADALKKASQQLQEKLSTYQGVHGIEDNMPFGAQEYSLQIKPQAKALGLQSQDIEREIATQLSGAELDRRRVDGEEVIVKLRLDKKSKNNSDQLSNLPIHLNGQVIPLEMVANITLKQGFSNYYSYNSQPGVLVTAETSSEGSTVREIIADLKQSAVSDIEGQYPVTISFETQARSQAKALVGIKNGAVIGIAMIYFVLAWVLKSYWWPLMVMLIIPVGLSGAILGHYLLGMHMSILSIFGLFGLTGIVVNDAIILLHRFQSAHRSQPVVTAMISACCERFRAVVLTSVTTVLGMMPLLLNKSLQAQFVIPLAVSLSAGLLMATTTLILLLPALTALIERFCHASDPN